jgi:hypothetical protein
MIASFTNAITNTATRTTPITVNTGPSHGHASTPPSAARGDVEGARGLDVRTKLVSEGVGLTQIRTGPDDAANAATAISAPVTAHTNAVRLSTPRM